MSYQQVNGSASTVTSTKNNFGTIKKGGNLAATDKWAVDQLSFPVNMVLNYPSIESPHVAKPLSAGTFLYGPGQLIRRVTSAISGVADTVLLSGASDYGLRRAIHFIESLKTSFLSSWSWTTDNNGNVNYTAVVDTGNQNFSQDDAAHPSAAVPGELIYQTGDNIPSQDEYQPRYQN